jgi:hypothetical protein
LQRQRFGHLSDVSTALALSSATLIHETLSGDFGFVDAERTLLVVVWSGRARLRLGEGDERLVGAGSVLMLPPGHDLALRSVEQLKLTRLCFDASRLLPEPSARETLGAFDAALSGPRTSQQALLGLSPRHAGAVSEAFGRIDAELQKPRLGHELLLRAQLLELIVTIARAEHSADQDPERHRPRLAQPGRVGQARRHVRQPFFLRVSRDARHLSARLRRRYAHARGAAAAALPRAIHLGSRLRGRLSGQQLFLARVPAASRHEPARIP